MGFPKKFAGRSTFAQPIIGELSSMPVDPDSRKLIEQIVNGLFLDMQDKSITAIMSACFLTGVHMAKAVKEGKADE